MSGRPARVRSPKISSSVAPSKTGIMALTELQLHGPEEELAKLRESFAALNPSYWTLEYGFRRA